jgi:membrane protein implicated in regulation of membrane protease activity
VLSVLVGLAAVATIPAAVVAAEFYAVVTLLESSVSIAPAAVLSILAILLGRRARRTVERTLGRARGGGLARLGRILGWLGVYLVVTASISVATYYVLREVAA